MWIPAEPTVDFTQRAEGSFDLRYEDISQDGHMVIEAMPTGLGVVWQLLLSKVELTQTMRAKGVLPILSRIVAEGGQAPIPAGGSARVEGCFRMAHTRGEDGEVSRILLGMWARLYGRQGFTHAPRDPSASEILIGSVHAEHVFTRPFGPPAERKVLRLDGDGLDPVPAEQVEWTSPESLAVLPEGAIAIDDRLIADDLPIQFGLDHTDSNQHVNSLVYPRLFIEAALRRHALGGVTQPLLTRSFDVAYRKPCFAGERVRIAVRAFTYNGRPGVVGCLVGQDEIADLASARPRCYARLLF